VNTHTKAADPWGDLAVAYLTDEVQSQQIKRPQHQHAERVQRCRKKVAKRRRSKRAQLKGDQRPRLAWPIDEGAHRIGIGRTSVYKLAAEGKLRLIKVAGRTLIPDSEVVRIAAEGA
jgi:hypothetical protein